MCEFLVFAGTSEGRALCEALLGYRVRLTACAATEYGGSLLPNDERLTVLPGKLEQAGMRALMKEGRFACVCDATHPFARQASENIKAACGESGTPYLRILRPRSEERDGIWVQSHCEAADCLAAREGNILLTTGSRNLRDYTVIPGWKRRLYIRILPAPEPIRQAMELDFSPGKIIAMQGPFSQELNLALLRQTGARFLVTKDSGEAGGLPQKLAAAREAGAQAIVVGRPPQEPGKTLEQAICYLVENWSLKEEKL
ncbi:precorrin-6A reductase [Harryflintia acetispora]|uniref:precorrin-6A reductase n=1 Tax=Harryflintia acetispora TaxID=1849041 RepID=UPI001897EC4E|nr:precorrin-6A reductase [Harryflintia acetispora]